MRLAALFSGGKDSTYAALLAKHEGHEISYLVTVRSANPDSWMWHTAAIELTELQAKVAGIPLIVVKTKGDKENEFAELLTALAKLEIDGIVCGAIASNYQRKRVEAICEELDIELFAPLWGKEPKELLNAMLADGFEIIFTAVAAEGFDKNWLGKRLDAKAIDELERLNKKYGVHISGEGGEYESAVLACPLFKGKIKIKAEPLWQGNSGVLKIIKAESFHGRAV
jgi:diphthine-ammonia ligase